MSHQSQRKTFKTQQINEKIVQFHCFTKMLPPTSCQAIQKVQLSQWAHQSPTLKTSRRIGLYEQYNSDWWLEFWKAFNQGGSILLYCSPAVSQGSEKEVWKLLCEWALQQEVFFDPNWVFLDEVERWEWKGGLILHRPWMYDQLSAIRTI